MQSVGHTEHQRVGSKLYQFGSICGNRFDIAQRVNTGFNQEQTAVVYVPLPIALQRRILYGTILVGVSRKSMVWRPLGLTPETCLAATQALQMYALEHGATILRTHDVQETARTIRVFEGLSPAGLV